MDNQDDQTTPNDAQQSATTPATTTSSDGADAARNFMTLDGLIKGYIRDLDKLREQLKEHQQMFKDGIENDALYKQHNDKVKEVTKAKNAQKQQLLKQPALVELVAKLNDLKDEIKTTQAGLVEYLIEYQKIAPTNQIVDDNGTVHEIVNTPKLVKKSAKYNP